MMKSYDKLRRDCMFEPDNGMHNQHQKIIEEFLEVTDEAIIIPEENKLFFRTRIENYVHEIQDLMLACNNQLLRIEKEYGKSFVKRAMDNWDKKIESYKKEKYKE